MAAFYEFTYMCDILRERRSKTNGTLIMKYAGIEELHFSVRYIVAVEEKMSQFNYLFKMLLPAHEEYNPLYKEETMIKDDEWFNEIHNYFPLKRK